MIKTFQDKFFEVNTAFDCILELDVFFDQLRRGVKINKNLIKRHLAVFYMAQYFVCVNVEPADEIRVEVSYRVSFVIVNQ